jgi:uncharacterized RDD family membrane protein YckC
MPNPGSAPVSQAARPVYGEALDSAVRVETPEGIEFTLFPAGPLVRGCAWGIDQVIQWVLIAITDSVLSFYGDDSGSWAALLIFFCIDWFYHTLWEIFGRGQSPGKRLLGIRVVRGDGAPVNPGASFLRNLLRFADTFLFLCPIALLTMLLNRACRRLGDWAAGTLVVYAVRPLSVSAMPVFAPVPGNPGAVPAELGLEALPANLSGEEKQGILMFARRYTLLGRARADEIASPYVKALRGDTAETPPGASADCLLAISRRLTGT